MLTKEEFIKRLAAQRQKNYLYKAECIKAANNENYIAYACEYIMQNEVEKVDGKWRLKNIARVRRERTSYNYPHDIPTERSTKSNRNEEWYVIDMQNDKEEVGFIKETLGASPLAYQIPLKQSNADKGVGKIDFVYLNDGEFYLAEIKTDDSKESSLRAILEIQTYYQIVAKDKLLADFNLPADTKINKIVVLFEGTKGAKQIQTNENVKKLLDLFDIKYAILPNPKRK